MGEVNNAPVEPTGPPPSQVMGPRVSDGMDRISVVGFVHLEHYLESPESIAIRMIYNPKHSAQLYSRRLDVNTSPVALDVGWVSVPGMVVIENRAGTRLQAVPSESQLAEIAEMVLEVVFPGGGITLVRPGRLTLLEPEDIQNVRLRSRSGKIPITLSVYSQ